MKVQALEQEAISALQECLAQIPFLEVERIERLDAGNGPDFNVGVRFQGKSRVMVAAVKNNGQPRYARLAAYELRDRLGDQKMAYGVFLAPYISPQAGKICADAGIGYHDLAGNCLLSFDTVYIHKTGIGNPKVQKRDLRSLYSPKAERVLRVLLAAPKKAWKVSALAQEAGVSLGQAANVKKLLLDREWIHVSAEGLRLSKPAELLDEWAQEYRFERSNVLDGYAMLEIPEIEGVLAEACQRLGLRYALAGFSSSARIAPMVRYQKAMAYVQGDLNALMQSVGWKTVSSGANISLLRPYDEGVFYDAKQFEGVFITAPAQTYVDLQSLRGRGQEAAQAVRRMMEKAW